MPRPRKDRKVFQPPRIKGIKPIGIPGRVLEKIDLSIDEYEAIRLADYENLSHIDAAVSMNISRPTFTRLIESARKKLAICIIDVKEILIAGGTYSFQNHLIRCRNCGDTNSTDITEIPPSHCPDCSSAEIEYLNGWFCPERNRRRGRGNTGRGRI